MAQETCLPVCHPFASENKFPNQLLAPKKAAPRKPKATGGILPILSRDMANRFQRTASARTCQFGMPRILTCDPTTRFLAIGRIDHAFTLATHPQRLHPVVLCCRPAGRCGDATLGKWFPLLVQPGPMASDGLGDPRWRTVDCCHVQIGTSPHSYPVALPARSGRIRLASIDPHSWLDLRSAGGSMEPRGSMEGLGPGNPGSPRHLLVSPRCSTPA